MKDAGALKEDAYNADYGRTTSAGAGRRELLAKRKVFLFPLLILSNSQPHKQTKNANPPPPSLSPFGIWSCDAVELEVEEGKVALRLKATKAANVDMPRLEQLAAKLDLDSFEMFLPPHPPPPPPFKLALLPLTHEVVKSDDDEDHFVL